MRVQLLTLAILFLAGCGTVAPQTPIQNSSWVSYNHKTEYAVEKIDANTIKLTVKYSAYTFLDKSTEAIPTAKATFRQIAQQLATQRGHLKAVFNDADFYNSTGYNGITGISETLVSNTVRFVSGAPHSTASMPKDSVLNKLRLLKEARDQGLISEQEYTQKKAEILHDF